jgi:hypothetical protein
MGSARSWVLFGTGCAVAAGTGAQLEAGTDTLGAACPPQASGIASTTQYGPNERTLERYPDKPRRSID